MASISFECFSPIDIRVTARAKGRDEKNKLIYSLLATKARASWL